MKKMKKSGMPVFGRVSPKLLETMRYEYPGRNIEVNIDTDEFTCICPWSGLPDFAKLSVSYVPARFVVELKSLKMYLQSFRMVGMVHESVVNRITDDLVKAVKPLSMSVELVFKVRGGITTTVKRRYVRKGSES